MNDYTYITDYRKRTILTANPTMIVFIDAVMVQVPLSSTVVSSAAPVVVIIVVISGTSLYGSVVPAAGNNIYNMIMHFLFNDNIIALKYIYMMQNNGDFHFSTSTLS